MSDPPPPRQRLRRGLMQADVDESSKCAVEDVRRRRSCQTARISQDCDEKKESVGLLRHSASSVKAGGTDPRSFGGALILHEHAAPRHAAPLSGRLSLVCSFSSACLFRRPAADEPTRPVLIHSYESRG